MPRLTIDGRPVEVPEGTNLIEAARAAGVEVPHYCYHPGLSVAGQCRLCMVDVDQAPRPTIACNTQARDGMTVVTTSERVLDTRRSIMEFHLVNHPLDCPVCDQAGECWLQIYYMRHGLYEPRMTDDKVHKPKAVPVGPHVMLDAERCILCSRCVRFCDEVTGTGELGIFHRGDHSELGLFPGTALANPYSGNVVDICPVGALTDRDFRFQVRVWYLDATPSVCPGCARGCNVEIHTNRARPHHAGGRRVARLKPRYHPEVNRWWLCDAGRYGWTDVDDPARLTTPLRRGAAEAREVAEPTAWDTAVAGVAAALAAAPAGTVGILASSRLSNEDLLAIRRLAACLGARVATRVPADRAGVDDQLLIRADRTPNALGARLLGVDGEAAELLEAARAGAVRTLVVFDHDLHAAGLPPEDVAAALAGVDTLVWIGHRANATSAGAAWVLPAAAWVERDGTWTNFEGRVQRFRQAVDPLGDALPVWEIAARLLAALGASATAPRAVGSATSQAVSSATSRAEQWFALLAREVPAFAGLTWSGLGARGALVAGVARERA